MKKDQIAFKGVKEGIYLEIYGSDLEDIKIELDKKILKSSGFFQGSKFLGVKANDLTEKDIHEIKCVLKYKYDFDIPLEFAYIEDCKMDIKPKNLNVENRDISKEGMTKFLHGTLRSGQVIEYDGNIVVVGDVNPGALLKATGNIIILGTFKGVAQAGIDGNTEVVVAAYNLSPSQLRIGDLIVRAPDEETNSYKYPEVARICNGEVVIEPYLPNK